MLKYIAAALIGYLLGCINSGLIVSKISFLDDVRRHGSGNAGATNMARVFGIGAGLLTLGGDMLKAVIAIWIGLRLGGDIGLCVAGIACTVGHCAPVFFNFRGGKGVSVGAACALMIDPRLLLILIGAFALGMLCTRKVSVGSVCAALGAVPGALLLAVSTPKLILAIIAAATILYQHRPNIKRLINKTEPDFKIAKRRPRT